METGPRGSSLGREPFVDRVDDEAGRQSLAVSRGRRPDRPRIATLGTSALLAIASVTLFAGCIGDGKSRVPDQRVTYIPKEQAQPAFYYRKPAAATVSAPDFDALWAAINRVTRNAGFYPDLEDHRLGLYISRPLVNSQWFEPWRGDTVTAYDRLDASISTHRRTVRWEVAREADGTFSAVPKVLVERYSLLEHRVTTGAQYNEIFALTQEEVRNQELRELDPSQFAEGPIPVTYWYATGRDDALEKWLASHLEDQVKS